VTEKSWEERNPELAAKIARARADQPFQHRIADAKLRFAQLLQKLAGR